MNYPLEKSIRRLSEESAAPSPEVKAEVMAYVRANPFARRNWLAWKMAGGTVLGTLFLGGGLAMASQSALPGHALYPMKLATEKIYTQSKMSPEDKAQAAQDLLERRNVEAQAIGDADSDADDCDSEWTAALASSSDEWVDAQDNLFSLAVADER